MEYRRFGRTNLAMPFFTCGGMRYNHSWKDVPESEIPEANQKNLEATVEQALSLGINHIETARGYGTSEFQLGRILPRLPREKMIVQTKVGPQENGAEFRKVFDRSLKNLSLEYVDLLGIHGINTSELLANTLAPGGALAAARELQREGRVRFVGFSTHADLPVILSAIETGEFDYVNLHWYWVNQVNTKAINRATAHDMGVFIISPNDKGGKLYEPPAKLVELCHPLSPMAFNNLFCWRNERVHTLSIGAARPSDFDEHVRSLDQRELFEPALEKIESRLIAEINRICGVNWWSEWQQGIPPWYEIPGEVNVWEIVRLWTLARGLDMIAFAKMRYNLLGQGGHWFPGKNAESPDLPGLRNALAACPNTERILEIVLDAHQLLYEAPQKRLSES